jgi:hypothetical protein
MSFGGKSLKIDALVLALLAFYYIYVLKVKSNQHQRHFKNLVLLIILRKWVADVYILLLAEFELYIVLPNQRQMVS